jgi:AraC family transcriptional regulator, transcriptional activator of the genes for pyochelin and ferripyochelin receptors
MNDLTSIRSFSPLEINELGACRVEIFQNVSAQEKNNFQLPGFTRMHAVGGYGAMQFAHFAGEGFDIWYSKYAIKNRSAFSARGNFHALELHIPFNSEMISWWDGGKENTLRDKQYDLSFFPFIDSRTEFSQANECSTFDIHYSPAYLKKFATHSSQLSAFLEKVERGERVDLLTHPQFLSPAMIALVNGVLRCDMPPELAGYYYESCAQLMLIEVLSRSGNEHTSSQIKYSAYDIERAIAAKEIIISDLSEKYSIASLAHATGFNEWKLQHTFKHLFGTTIFDYAQSARLDHAKYLLHGTKDPIQFIAAQCGYPDHANLTAAFKKKFGYTPENFRAQKKINEGHTKYYFLI